MNDTLSFNEAYLAIYAFLENYYEQTKSDDVASILTGLSLILDGLPMDRAFHQEWLVCVEKAKTGKVYANLNLSN